MIRFKMSEQLFEEIQRDLSRPHKFALERVGFIGTGLAIHGCHCTIIAHSYKPVADEDYLPDPNVCAMMGPNAMHKAMAWAVEQLVGLFHIHTHGLIGMPKFSHTDIVESDRFIPHFFKASPQRPHGTIVLSKTHAFGRVWLNAKSPARPIDEFHLIGSHTRKWSTR